MYLEAFRRLVLKTPLNVEVGTLVSQNNVAKEAGKDPSALKLSRFPSVIKKIQTYLELTNELDSKKRIRNAKVKKGKLTAIAKIATLEAQAIETQSKLLSVERRLIEVLQENAELQAKLDELLPPPAPFRSL